MNELLLCVIDNDEKSPRKKTFLSAGKVERLAEWRIVEILSDDEASLQ